MRRQSQPYPPHLKYLACLQREDVFRLQSDRVVNWVQMVFSFPWKYFIPYTFFSFDYKWSSFFHGIILSYIHSFFFFYSENSVPRQQLFDSSIIELGSPERSRMEILILVLLTFSNEI